MVTKVVVAIFLLPFIFSGIFSKIKGTATLYILKGRFIDMHHLMLLNKIKLIFLIRKRAKLSRFSYFGEEKDM